MTSYIIKSILCSGLLLLVYHLFLEQEKMHRFNRFYLLFSIIFSLTIPLLTVEMKADVLSQTPTNPLPVAAFSETASEILLPSSSESQVTKNSFPQELLYIGYGLISMLLLARFFKNFRSVFIRKPGQKTVDFHGARLILLPQNVVTYTFLNNIFVTESAFRQNQIKDEVLTHELAHVRQKHTLDVLFIELLKSAFWINPLWFLYKKAIQLNHEFLADEAVLTKHHNPENYQLLLLDKILYNRQVTLTSSFNYSITKKRLTMMTKTTNPAKGFFKQAVIAFLTFGLAFLFCEKIYSQNEKAPAIAKPEKTIYKEKSGAGLSKEEMDEFTNTIEKYTNRVTNKKGRTDLIVEMTPAMEDHMYGLYTSMSKEQQKQQKDAGVRMFKMEIPVKKAPTPEMFEKWKILTIFGVWINNKHVPNSELEKYKYTDIAEYSLSKLYGAALKGRIYKYQLDLLTNDYFDKIFKKRANDRVDISRRGFYKKPSTN